MNIRAKGIVSYCNYLVVVAYINIICNFLKLAVSNKIVIQFDSFIYGERYL